MSGDVYSEPGLISKVYCNQDDRENIVNIYVSAESLRVFDKPWVEGTSPNPPGPAEAQQYSVVSQHSRRRNRVRPGCVFLCVVALLLLAVITFLGVYISKEKNSWRREEKQLMDENNNLRTIIELFTTNDTEVSTEIDDLLRTYCNLKPRKPKHLDQLDYT